MAQEKGGGKSGAARGVTPRSEDFAKWYNDVVLKAELADYSPVKGSMVIRPYGFALWEQIQGALDARIKATGHQNAYFPLLIPMSFMRREAEHVEGFAPELAVVTHAGGKDLEESLVVRPTSETLIGEMFAKWVHSYRDLPLLINQWANVVRWELRPRLFLRTTEFLWQEGHTVHATEAEAWEETRRMLDVYVDFAENVAALPVIPGRKSDAEKFKGAVASLTIEAMMGDRRALQCGTSHFLGQNFSKAFNITFLNESNQQEFGWQTSWGASTRLVGAVVMAHGDDRGLVLPPKLAPYQVVVVPIYRTDEERAAVLRACDEMRSELGEQVRLKVDDREQFTAGYKFNDWEMRGVPVRIEIGPRDVAQVQVMLARRDTSEKAPVPRSQLRKRLHEMLEEIQRSLFDRAKAFQENHLFRTDDYAAFQTLFTGEGARGFALAHWCGSADCEKRVSGDTRASIRCIPFDRETEAGACIACGNPSEGRVVFGKAY